MNTYYRLELAFFDEPQGCGFLHGLDDIGLSEKSPTSSWRHLTACRGRNVQNPCRSGSQEQGS